MKLSLDKSQIVLLACLGVVLLVGAVLGWWGLGSLFEELGKAQQLVDRRGKSEISEILAHTGGGAGIKKEISDLEKLNATLIKQEEALIGAWEQAFLEASGDGKEWSKDGNKWKDLLVKYNDEILKKSGKVGDNKKIVLAQNFYLGLEDYKQKSPPDDLVPLLAEQLVVSKRLLDLLISVKGSASEGYPTSCVVLKLQGPLGQETESPERSKNKGKPSVDLKDNERAKYLLEFECSPEVLFGYVYALVKDAYFFVPTELTIENEKENFPKRSELSGLFEPPKAKEADSTEPSRGGGESTPPLLLVLAGKERLRVNLAVDFVRWKRLREPKGGETPKS